MDRNQTVKKFTDSKATHLVFMERQLSRLKSELHEPGHDPYNHHGQQIINTIEFQVPFLTPSRDTVLRLMLRQAE
jgi:hypothetical protein